MDEIAVPLRHPSAGSPTFSSGSPSTHWDNACPPTGVLQPSPRMRDVPKLSPLVAHRVHVDPLSGLEFTSESILTICREGLVKIWARPSNSEKNQQIDSSEQIVGNATSKDKVLTSLNKAAGASSSSFKQPSSVVFS
jgi:WD repeat-containing protein 20